MSEKEDGGKMGAPTAEEGRICDTDPRSHCVCGRLREDGRCGGYPDRHCATLREAWGECGYETCPDWISRAAEVEQ